MPLDDPKEMFVQVNEVDEVIGLVSRKDAHSNPSIIHRAVCVLVINNAHQLLLQLRSSSKDMFPGYWGLSCAGHVTGYDSYEETAKRELEEELGLHFTLYEIMTKLFKIPEESEIVKVYGCTFSNGKIKYDTTEIEKVVWVDFNTLKRFTHQNLVTPMDVDLLKRLNYLHAYVPPR